MKFLATSIAGVVVVELEELPDERGMFARTFSKDEFAARGLLHEPVEANLSFNHAAGTLRGMHYQAEPHPEAKLVRCTRGSMFDVAVDLRPDSPSYCRWFGVTLAADERNALHIPPGCAHGFVTLEDATEVLYLMGERYYPELARGVRWNDPAFGIEWPVAPAVISGRDAAFEDFTP